MSVSKSQKHERLDSRKPKSPARKMPEITFHNIRLTKADKDALEDFVTVCRHDMDNALTYLVERGGYKVSIREDENSESIMVSITGSEWSANPNVCVTTYAENVDDCLWMALYKAFDPRKPEWYVWELEPERGNKRWG